MNSIIRVLKAFLEALAVSIFLGSTVLLLFILTVTHGA